MYWDSLEYFICYVMVYSLYTINANLKASISILDSLL